MEKESKKIKEDFLSMLRDRNIYVKEDIIKEKNKKGELKEEIEPINPNKKIFKHKEPLKKLREVYIGEI